jgi:putative acetyltransferase
MIEIIEYEDQYIDDFRSLNLEWLDKYHLKEEPDLVVLNDPRGTIIHAGGAIYLAKAENEIIGSAAIMKEHDGVFELAKMTVAPAWRGKGISRLLMEKCLDKARELGATRIILFSNHQLQTAIALYRKFGFEHVEVTDSPFVTADVKMERYL